MTFHCSLPEMPCEEEGYPKVSWWYLCQWEGKDRWRGVELCYLCFVESFSFRMNEDFSFIRTLVFENSRFVYPWSLINMHFCLLLKFNQYAFLAVSFFPRWFFPSAIIVAAKHIGICHEFGWVMVHSVFLLTKKTTFLIVNRWVLNFGVPLNMDSHCKM